jgi:GT2 family glycosyltransferase
MGAGVCAVIVNWNGGGQLARCLRSFDAVKRDDVAFGGAVVVDNASTDDSVEQAVASSRQLPLRVIHNRVNVGFAAACNQGAEAAAAAGAEFLLFLNPDTELRPGCLEQPARFLDDPANASVGIVGVQLLDGQGRMSRTCSRHPTVLSLIGHTLGLDRVFPAVFPPHFLPQQFHEGIRQVDQVMGAFFFVRRDLFERLGGFDERFFLYFEDADFALRARKLGQSSAYLATACAVHHGHGSSDQVKARRLFYFARSRMLFGAKHFGFAGGCAVAAATLLVEPLLRSARVLLTGRVGEIADVLRGFGMLWSEVAGLTNRPRVCGHA